MKVKQIKSEKGVTLLELTVYIIVLFIVLGTLTIISNFFNDNMDVVRYSAKYAGEFDKFNSAFLEDTKENSSANINGNIITFINGTTYKYSEEDSSIYRGQVKIATNVKSFSAKKKIITINNLDKEIISINIIIGNSSNNLLNKSIDYTLKYW